jgi:hypothetical protein
MRKKTPFTPILRAALLVLMLVSVQAQAQRPSGRGRGLYGDWHVKYEVGERQREAILAFSRNAEGERSAQWISFMGLSELKDLKFEDGQLSFSRVSRNRNGDSTTSSFKGTIQDGKLSGTMSSDRGEYTLKGEPSPRVSRAVGTWQMKMKREDREFESTLVVKADAEGNLSAQWRSERGELDIPSVQYERGNLKFKVERKTEDRQWEATFEGSIQRDTDTLSGAIKSERGEMAVEGKRMGAPLIGTWNLEAVSDRGTRKNRLRVNPDMSALYGAIPVKKVTLEGKQVSFKIVLEFGDQSFEMDFAGKLEDAKLTGELSSSRGSQKITGTKLVRRFTRRGSR